MKKLLFGLLALSAATFAANPGTATSADMQIQATLAIVDATDKLVIEELTGAGTWRVVSAIVSFDHGTVAKGSTTTPIPTLQRSFRVRKLNATGGDNLTGTVEIALDGNNTGTSIGNLESGLNKINHTFRFTPTVNVPAASTDKLAKFNIESSIPNTLSATQAVGLYSRVQTVTVELKP